MRVIKVSDHRSIQVEKVLFERLFVVLRPLEKEQQRGNERKVGLVTYEIVPPRQ